MTRPDAIDAVLARAGAAIQARLDSALAEFGTEPFAQAMAHATRGGKRLRGFLVLEGARLHGVGEAVALWPACAIEVLHAYSLVHDDLPAMDDDDLRRGQPTVHVRWDEATAILAGDALHALAFELVTDPRGIPEAGIRAALAHGLAVAAGGRGMVLGQALDIAAESAPAPLSLDAISALQAGKTGALIGWAAEAGAILGRADPDPLRRYARALGLAFQIADDILDVEGDAARAGKRLQKDEAAGKATFVSHLGLDGARARAAALVEEAEAALDSYGAEAAALREVARFVIARDR